MFNENINSLKLVNLTLPNDFMIYQNFPNPFNSKTTIQYSLPMAGKVTISLFNSIGERIKIISEEFQDEGFHKNKFRLMNLAREFISLRLNI